MNEKTMSAITTALAGAIMLTQEALEDRGMLKHRASLLTKGMLAELVFKFTDVLMGGGIVADQDAAKTAALGGQNGKEPCDCKAFRGGPNCEDGR